MFRTFIRRRLLPMVANELSHSEPDSRWHRVLEICVWFLAAAGARRTSAWYVLLLRWLCLSLTIGVSLALVPGLFFFGGDAIWSIVVMATSLGVVNTFSRWTITNGLLLWLAAWMSANWFHRGIAMDDFWAWLLGSLAIIVLARLAWIVLPAKQ